MIKLLIAGKRCPGKERGVALHHLRTVHGPLVYDPPADAGEMPARYVQNHVFDGPDVAALRPFQADRDLVTEIWFDDFARLRAATQTAYYRTVLRPDESNFVDQTSVLHAVVCEEVISEADLPAASKLFLFLKRMGGTEPDAFGKRCAAAVAAIRDADDDVVGHTVNTPLAPPGIAPFIDRMEEFWFADRAGAERFYKAALPKILAGLEDALDTGGTFHLLADEFNVARLRGSEVSFV